MAGIMLIQRKTPNKFATNQSRIYESPEGTLGFSKKL